MIGVALYLLDNSVVQRMPRARPVGDAVLEFTGRGDLLACSDVSLLEAGHSARNATEHARILNSLGEDFHRLPLTDQVGVVATDLQAGLFASGHGRAVGVGDLLLAATAIVHDAVLVHYDADFELLAEADQRLRHRWIVPRGSVD